MSSGNVRFVETEYGEYFLFVYSLEYQVDFVCAKLGVDWDDGGNLIGHTLKNLPERLGVRTFFRAFYAAYPSRRRLPSIVSHTVLPSSLKYLILSVLYRLSHPSSISMNSVWETPRQSRP